MRPITDGSDPLLVAMIREEIVSSPERRITFARFMERALTEPGLGYYATSDQRPTRAGDFLTAPELHPVFGRCIGRLLAAVWTRLGEPTDTSSGSRAPAGARSRRPRWTAWPRTAPPSPAWSSGSRWTCPVVIRT